MKINWKSNQQLMSTKQTITWHFNSLKIRKTRLTILEFQVLVCFFAYLRMSSQTLLIPEMRLRWIIWIVLSYEGKRFSWLGQLLMAHRVWYDWSFAYSLHIDYHFCIFRQEFAHCSFYHKIDSCYFRTSPFFSSYTQISLTRLFCP